MTEPTPILNINLFDIKIPDNVVLYSQFLNEAKDLARNHKALFDEKEIPIDIFHNCSIAYSGIQFSRYLGSACFTAIGKKEVEALRLWYKLFIENSQIPVLNTRVTNEVYYPEITNNLINYSVNDILLKKEIHDEIKGLTNQFAKSDRFEKYLYGNIKSFLQRQLGMHIGEKEYISVKVQEFSSSGYRPTYHGGSLAAFRIKFCTNVYLPHILRLGQAVALGYGLVMHRQ